MRRICKRGHEAERGKRCQQCANISNRRYAKTAAGRRRYKTPEYKENSRRWRRARRLVLGLDAKQTELKRKRLYSQALRNTLADRYIKGQLYRWGITWKLITPDLIELKREALAAHRLYIESKRRMRENVNRNE